MVHSMRIRALGTLTALAVLLGATGCPDPIVPPFDDDQFQSGMATCLEQAVEEAPSSLAGLCEGVANYVQGSSTVTGTEYNSNEINAEGLVGCIFASTSGYFGLPITLDCYLLYQGEELSVIGGKTACLEQAYQLGFECYASNGLLENYARVTLSSLAFSGLPFIPVNEIEGAIKYCLDHNQGNNVNDYNVDCASIARFAQDGLSECMSSTLELPDGFEYLDCSLEIADQEWVPIGSEWTGICLEQPSRAAISCNYPITDSSAYVSVPELSSFHDKPY